jgi:hypothetical protein
LWEQKNMVVGTKNYYCENKSMIVGTNTYGCGNKSMDVGQKKLWFWQQNLFMLKQNL